VNRSDQRADFEHATHPATGATIIEFPRPAGARPFEHDPLTAVVTAADHVVSALGHEGAWIAYRALTGDQVPPDELAAIHGLANALSWLLDGGARC